MASVSDLDKIRALSAENARAILIYLCDDQRICRKASSLAADIGSKSAKRKATSQLVVCVQCDEVFDEDDNKAKNCRYHSGELEVDWDRDFWADHDENCHGIIDTDEMREEYPDGFQWTCCENVGSEAGCKRGRHQADPAKSMKGSYESEAETEEDEDDVLDEENEEEKDGI